MVYCSTFVEFSLGPRALLLVALRCAIDSFLQLLARKVRAERWSPWLKSPAIHQLANWQRIKPYRVNYLRSESNVILIAPATAIAFRSLAPPGLGSSCKW